MPCRFYNLSRMDAGRQGRQARLFCQFGDDSDLCQQKAGRDDGGSAEKNSRSRRLLKAKRIRYTFAAPSLDVIFPFSA